jgi:hypothetical protein
MLGKGEEPPGLIGTLLAQHEAAFLSDLGGREHASEMEQACCRRLAELELFVALVKAKLTTEAGVARRLSSTQTKELLTLHASMVRSFVQTASALGLKRREVEPDELSITRYAPAQPGGGNGQ